MGKIYSSKIINTNSVKQTNTQVFNFNNMPYDILLHIATFLNKRDKINFKQLDKFISNYYYTYLDTSDSVAISCYRNNMNLINKYFGMKDTQKLIFTHIIKNSQIKIFNNFPLNNLYTDTYETIIKISCAYNRYEIIKQVFNYIQNINFDIIFVKNVFANQHYRLFELLYTLPIVYRAPLNSIFVEACILGCMSIINKMLENPNINPGYDANHALNKAISYKQYRVVELLVNSRRIDQNIQNCNAFRKAVECNNLEMVKILFTDNRLEINHINLMNIQEIMRKPEIFEYILNSDKINYNFINSCIYHYLICNDFNKIKILIKHPKFMKNTLYPNEYGHILLSRITFDNIELLDIFLDGNNLEFACAVLKKIVEHYYTLHKNKFILLLTFIIDKVNKDYVLTALLDILNTRNSAKYITDIYNIIQNSESFFDTAYELCYYDLCKTYLTLPNTDISKLFNGFRQGKYNKIARLFLNYY